MIIWRFFVMNTTGALFMIGMISVEFEKKVARA